MFVPCPDGLLVNLYEAKEMVADFLNKLPVWFEKNMQTGSALGSALQAAYKLMVCLPVKLSVLIVTRFMLRHFLGNSCLSVRVLQSLKVAVFVEKSLISLFVVGGILN